MSAPGRLIRVARHDHHISLESPSPFNLPDARRLYIVLKWYGDGDGGSKGGYVTLAGLAAPEPLWTLFDLKWGEMLDHHGVKWWHTTDAMNLAAGARRDFLKNASATWNILIATETLRDLRAVVNRMWDERWRQGFQIYTCTVELTGYNDALARNPLLRTPHAICVHNCVGTFNLHEEDAAVLFFDRGEKFMKEIDQVWSKLKGKRRRMWAHQITDISKNVDARLVRPLQAADLLTWEENLACVSSAGADATRFVVPNRAHRYYGLPEIEAEYTPDRERKRAEKIREARRSSRETKALEQLELSESGLKGGGDGNADA